MTGTPGHQARIAMTDSFDTGLRPRLEALPTTALSDALDSHGLRGCPLGILPIHEAVRKFVGRAVTVKFVSAGETKTDRHGCVEAVQIARKGDVICVDNGGRMDTNAWGGILAFAAAAKGIAGVVADGAVRDVDEIFETGLPVYGRGRVPLTARGRTIEESTNAMIEIGGIQVRPDDVICGDRSGVVIIPREHVELVLSSAEEINAKEMAMIEDIKAGMSMIDVNHKYNYENMLKKGSS
jgi:regulator of RNase E activity RraA